MAMMRVCAQAGCGRLVPEGTARYRRCPDCATSYGKREAAKRKARPQQRIWESSAWRRVRKLALDRDGHRCGRCAATVNLSVHHITPMRESGAPFDLANLETLCKSCHGREHGGTQTAEPWFMWGG
jgi:5-methylcytosine-specific restriction endonuclease McrA